MDEPPLCPECWGLDIESHKCPEENFPGENKNQLLRNYMKKKAQNEWKEFSKSVNILLLFGVKLEKNLE